MHHRGRAFLAFAVALLLGGDAWSLNMIEISGNGGAGTIVDQGPGDLDPDVDEIEAEITLVGPGGHWIGTGTVFATGGGNVAPDLIFTDVLLQNVTGVPIAAGIVSIEFTFDPVPDQPLQQMVLDGEFDNLAGPVISGVELDFTGLIDGDAFGSIHEGPYGPVGAPKPFDGMIGPVLPPRDFTSQRIDLVFYLDGFGDAIRLFNSAEILSVPEPGAAALLVVALVALLARASVRARSATSGKKTVVKRSVQGLVAAAWLVTCAPVDVEAQGGPRWLDLSDQAFAAEFADRAFGESLAERERIAWMIFARVNQLVDDAKHGGMSGTKKVPVWMTWPTDPDTFGTRKPFVFDKVPRSEMQPSTEKKDLESGRVGTADPDGSNEEVTRNELAYDYLVRSGLTTRLDVAAFFETHDAVDMPVGSIELKASWLQVTPGSPAPEGALTFEFESGKYWWRGLHLMVKMRSLDDPADVFYSEDPSWFWSTFEFNHNPGVEHVRETLITQRSPLPPKEIAAILDAAGLAGFGLEHYAPNGTQIRFTVGGTGETPVILGHTDMEDFAGSPNTAQPRYWTGFEASCHACHATAAYNPETQAFFPFSVPTGALEPGYNMTDGNQTVQYLGQGYRPLDFMWPIAFQAK